MVVKNKKGKESKLEYVDFSLFDIQYGFVGGAVCRIAKQLILESLKGTLTKKELKSLK